MTHREKNQLHGRDREKEREGGRKRERVRERKTGSH